MPKKRVSNTRGDADTAAVKLGDALRLMDLRERTLTITGVVFGKGEANQTYYIADTSSSYLTLETNAASTAYTSTELSARRTCAAGSRRKRRARQRKCEKRTGFWATYQKKGNQDHCVFIDTNNWLYYGTTWCSKADGWGQKYYKWLCLGGVKPASDLISGGLCP
jgi:hypothetical protein